RRCIAQHFTLTLLPPLFPIYLSLSFLSSCSRGHRDLHSFPTRRSSDLYVFVNGPVVAWNVDMPALGDACASIERRTTAHTIRRRVPARAEAADGHTSRMNSLASSRRTAACSSEPGGMSGQRAFRSSTVANGIGSTSAMTPPLVVRPRALRALRRGRPVRSTAP